MMRAVGCCDFAGSYAKGVVQAGFDYVAKREPSAFGGFGVTAIEANFHGVQIEVTEPEFWSVVADTDMIFGCPPCSGFSNLSVLNTRRTPDGLVPQRGIDSPDNKWMFELIDYSAKVKPKMVVFESVGAAGVLGAPLMRELWQRLREKSGLDYHFTDVFMNAALVGGDVIRRRYFFVAHLQPFGVDLPRETPRTLMEVIGDLGPAPYNRRDEGIDMEWGHVTNGSLTDYRTRKTIELFNSEGFDWDQGTRLRQHLETWMGERGHDLPDWWYGKDGHILTYAITDSMYVPFRWYADKPMGVVAGGFLDRAVHPTEPRGFTYREGARFMGLPDDWSLFPIVSGKNDAWLGKAIPVASGRWVSTWAKASIEERPGEYAGTLVEDKHRVIDVATKQRVDKVDKMGEDEPVWWPAPERPAHFVAGPIGFLDQSKRKGVEPTRAEIPPAQARALGLPVTPAHRKVDTDSRLPVAQLFETSVVSTKAAPGQMDDAGAHAFVRRPPARVSRAATPAAVRPPREPRPPVARGTIERVRPEEFRSFMEGLTLTRSQVADALGVSHSRVAELVGTAKPGSWLNVERWAEVQETLRAAALTAVG